MFSVSSIFLDVRFVPAFFFCTFCSFSCCKFFLTFSPLFCCTPSPPTIFYFLCYLYSCCLVLPFIFLLLFPALAISLSLFIFFLSFLVLLSFYSLFVFPFSHLFVCLLFLLLASLAPSYDALSFCMFSFVRDFPTVRRFCCPS